MQFCQVFESSFSPRPIVNVEIFGFWRESVLDGLGRQSVLCASPLVFLRGDPRGRGGGVVEDDDDAGVIVVIVDVVVDLFVDVDVVNVVIGDGGAAT